MSPGYSMSIVSHFKLWMKFKFSCIPKYGGNVYDAYSVVFERITSTCVG